MIDPFSNPQAKLQHQSQQQVTEGRQTKLDIQPPGQPSSTLSPGQPTAAPIPTDTLTPKQVQDAQEQQAQDRKGFKQALQDSKSKAIDRGKQHLQEKSTSAINSYTQPQQESQDSPTPHINRSPQASPPEPTPPNPTLPNIEGRPSPGALVTRKPPRPRSPKLQIPPRPKMK